MIIREEKDFWIILGKNHLSLMHRLENSEFQVGEAFCDNGVWEIRRAERKGQILVRITDSPTEALEVLWEQRTTMNWGYYQ